MDATTLAEKSIDISTETSREYIWADGAIVRIKNPVTLVVSDNGHRVVNAEGHGFYVTKGWRYLRWFNKPGAAPLVA